MKAKIDYNNSDYEIDLDIEEVSTLYCDKYLISKKTSEEKRKGIICGFMNCLLDFGNESMFQSVVYCVENEIIEKHKLQIDDEIETKDEQEREEKYMKEHQL